MKLGNFSFVVVIKAVIAVVIFSGSNSAHSHDHKQHKVASESVYEMRTYTTFDGKFPALNERFREHTIALFEKHGMQNVGYWIPQDKPNTLIYILLHKSRDSAKESWQAFINDPKWQQAYQASIENGKLVSNIDSVFMTATDYSVLK